MSSSRREVGGGGDEMDSDRGRAAIRTEVPYFSSSSADPLAVPVPAQTQVEVEDDLRRIDAEIGALLLLCVL